MRGYWRPARALRPGDRGARISSSDNGAPSAWSEVEVRNWHQAYPRGRTRHFRSWGQTGRTINLATTAALGRVGMWRGGVRSTVSVAAPFVWRCLSGSAITPFPHPAHRTQRADFPHCALGQDFTPSPTTGRAHAGSDVRARSARRGARVDMPRLCVA